MRGRPASEEIARPARAFVQNLNPALSQAPGFPQLGVGLQYNPALVGWFPFLDQSLDVLEVLFDGVMGPLDGPGLMWPGKADALDAVAARFPLVGHSNYGGDFGFEPLHSTVAVRQHMPLAKRFAVPWVSNHCFYGDESWSDVWSSPLQFSEAEAIRVADRARTLQDLYGVPLAHENAAYYRTCPGSNMREEEFLAQVVERAGTWLHLDLHNLYTNATNFGASGYSIERFLSVIPLDRVVVIHMAGGRWFDAFYHDLHDTRVPEPVWDLLENVLSRCRPGAVVLEYEAKALVERGQKMDREATIDLILSDLERARTLWDRAYGPRSRTATRLGMC
jgi:uncharacterized protein (UPF0276 family)